MHIFVFEGLKKPKESIDENEKTETFLAYSSSKVVNEEQLKIDWYNSCSIPTWYPDNVMLIKKVKNT